MQYQGPFFKRDPAQVLADNLREYIWEVGEYAEETAKNAAPFRTGELRDHIALRAQNRTTGKRWRATVVISTWGLGVDPRAWPGTRRPSRIGRVAATGYYNWSGKVEARYHFMKKGRKALLASRRASRHLLKGLT